MIHLLCLAVLAPPTIQGTVTMASGKPAKSAVVFFEGSEKSKPMKNAIVDQRGRQFIPHISVVTVGTTIKFPNNDTVFHNIFADYNAKVFDLGMYAKGDSRQQKFDKPGLVAMLCSIHSEMSAYVWVVDTPFFAVADAKGNYTIPNMTPGAYTMRAWHESGETFSGKVTVGDAPAKLDAQTKRQKT